LGYGDLADAFQFTPNFLFISSVCSIILGCEQ